MKLIAKDYTFYPNGLYKLKGGYQCSATSSYYTDLEVVSSCIRIFGTEEEVEKALTDYIIETGLALDESYPYRVEVKDSYYYFGEKYNKKVKEKLKMYKTLYERQIIKKPLIIGI
jgi:hypothetical protein